MQNLTLVCWTPSAKHAMDAASVRFVLMMVEHKKWNIITLDVATALFEGTINRELTTSVCGLCW